MSSATRLILVVEDNTAMGLVLRLNLERAGYEVVVAGSAEEAWQLLESQNFHLAVIDHCLPGMHGAELCAKIRDRDELHDMPLMMLTAKKLELKVDQLLNELRVWRVIPKPFSPNALTRWIHECLTQHDLQTAATNSRPASLTTAR